MNYLLFLKFIITFGYQLIDRDVLSTTAQDECHMSNQTCVSSCHLPQNYPVLSCFRVKYNYFNANL